MISTFHAAPFMRVKLMHGGASAAGARAKEVRVPVIELPLDYEVGRPLDLGANVELFPTVHLLDHLLPAIRILPGAELPDDAVAHYFIILRIYNAHGLPPFEVDPYRRIVGGLLGIGLSLRPVNHGETGP